jgi:nucleoside-diphosphate-sugar epimerase
MHPLHRNPSSVLAPGTPRHVLLIGATGVVGGAVISELRHHQVTALTHRSKPASEVGTAIVRGDLAQPRLGLTDQVYEELAGRVDCVINCGGLSHAGSSPEKLRSVNIDGTREVIAFCQVAGASLAHISTAAREIPDVDVDSAFSIAPYLRSKREADRLISESRLDAAVIKPSQVMGDTQTGFTPRFQGLHKLGELLIEDELGILPVDGDSRVDFLPRDTVARAVVALVGRPTIRGEWWLTAGADALTAERTVDVICEAARSIGRSPPDTRLVGADVIDRLVRPALLPELPRRARLRLEYAIEYSRLIQPREGDASHVYPTAIPELLCQEVLSSEVLEAALRKSIDYWVSFVGLDKAPAEMAS